ncbi:MAG: hypothetical protein R3F62_22940 [Planctomycetota bacterium]
MARACPREPAGRRRDRASLFVPRGGIALPWQTAWGDADQPVDGGWLLLGLGLTLAALMGLLGFASRRAQRPRG